MKRLLIPLAAVLGLFVLSANAASESKTIYICEIGKLCNIPPSLRSSANEIRLRYRSSGPGGTGKEQALGNGSKLHSGDLFTIEVTANEPVYLYLFHFDSHGQLSELLSLSDYGNALEAKQTIVLPASGKHFFLDENTGLETFHTIVSPHPLNDLKERYQMALSGNSQMQRLAQNEIKGIKIATDQPAHDETKPVAEKAGRTLACQGGDACRESFTIHHLPR